MVEPTLELIQSMVQRVLDGQRATDQKIDHLRTDMREVKTRLGIIEQQYASVSSRIDQIELRLDRIDSRMELVDTLT
jgi:septation ring formation regulator EzrA